jgi:hypothetical protein
MRSPDKLRRGRRRDHRGGGGHQPDKVAAAGAHSTGGSTVRGGEGGFGSAAPATRSSSGGDGGILEHREANRRVRRGPKEMYEAGQQSSPREGSSSDGGLDSRWGGDGASG